MSKDALSSIDRIKQDKQEAIKTLFKYVNYATEENKEKAIKSFTNSTLSIEEIKLFVDQCKEFQGVGYGHYS